MVHINVSHCFFCKLCLCPFMQSLKKINNKKIIEIGNNYFMVHNIYYHTVNTLLRHLKLK
jgi:hypothetical protein